MEKLTSLATLRASDIEKIQKLESELDRANTQKHNYEEKGKKFKATMEEVRCCFVTMDDEIKLERFPPYRISVEQIRFVIGL